MESVASEEFDFELTDVAMLGLDMRVAATAAARVAPTLDVAAQLRLVTNVGLRPRSSMGTRGDGSDALALRFVAGCVRCAPGAKHTCERVHARGNHSQLARKPARNQSGLSKDESLRVAESFVGYSIRYGLDTNIWVE